MKSIFIPVALLTFTGCDALVEHADTLTCTFVPYQAGDCADPAIKEKVVSVLSNGAVDAKITCNGLAFSPDFSKVVNVRYVASRLQDDSCFAQADVFGPVLGTGTGGFTQSSGSDLSARFEPASETCSVVSLHGPALQSRTFVENGMITVESPFCTSSVGTTCTMSVAGNCSGLNTDKF